MNEKISGLINTTKAFLTKHSPEILVTVGTTGMIVTTVLAVKATPKAMMLLEEAKKEKDDNKLTPIEVVKTAWKPYIPAVLTGLISVSCIAGGHTVSAKRQAALTTAYTLSEKALTTYKDKVIETIGEKKEKEIREKISQDKINENPVSKSPIVVTQIGNTICMDSISGRYFKSDINEIKKAINELNREMNYENYISLNRLYNSLGLSTLPNGDRLGWSIDDGLIELEFDACLDENSQPCLVVNYSREPKYNFDKLL